MKKTHPSLFHLYDGAWVERERENEYVDRAIHRDVNTQQALQICGFYKFWNFGSLGSQPTLLQMFVNYWDPNTEAFMLYGMPLWLEVEDIYFITQLSHWGKVLNLRDHGVGKGLTINENIAVYCIPNTQKVGIQVPINSI